MSQFHNPAQDTNTKPFGTPALYRLLEILGIIMGLLLLASLVVAVLLLIFVTGDAKDEVARHKSLWVLGLMVLTSISSCSWCVLLEDRVNKLGNSPTSPQSDPQSSPPPPKKDSDPEKTPNAFLLVLGALMGLIAKADGHVDESEIRMAEKSFARLGLNEGEQAECILGFRQAQRESFTAIDYGHMMVAMRFNMELRQLTYEILWDIACADGILDHAERELLEKLAPAMRLPQGTFRYFYQHRVRQRNTEHEANNPPPPSPRPDPLATAYQELGCSSSDDDETLRKTYRERVKKLHPDVLRAEGMPESLMDRANARMARINAAWKLIKKARNL